MNQVQLKDKKFSLFIEEEKILASIVALAEKINIDYKDRNLCL
jgi:hypoxanthine-guanine phosphoribosyltransferase